MRPLAFLVIFTLSYSFSLLKQIVMCVFIMYALNIAFSFVVWIVYGFSFVNGEEGIAILVSLPYRDYPLMGPTVAMIFAGFVILITIIRIRRDWIFTRVEVHERAWKFRWIFTTEELRRRMDSEIQVDKPSGEITDSS